MNGLHRMSDSARSAATVKKDPFLWGIIGLLGFSLMCLAIYTWLDARMLRSYGPGSGPPLSSETLTNLLMSMRHLVWAAVVMNCTFVGCCLLCYTAGRKRWLKSGSGER